MKDIQEKIIVIIPTYNEEKTIKEIIEEIKLYSKNILVIDSKKSTDKTSEIARSAGVSVIKDNGKGKGAAIRQAIEHVKEEVMVFIDADGSHCIKDIPNLTKPIISGKADMVVASRMLGGSDELHGTFINFFKMAGTGVIQLIINYRWDVNLTDSENGFRAIRADVAKKLKLRANDFDIEQEMVMKCLKKGFKLTEISSHEYSRKYGNPKLKLIKSGWKFIWRLIVDIF